MLVWTWKSAGIVDATEFCILGAQQMSLAAHDEYLLSRGEETRVTQRRALDWRIGLNLDRCLGERPFVFGTRSLRSIMMNANTTMRRKVSLTYIK